MTAQSSFWARRKAAVEAEELAEARAAEEAVRAEALAEKDDAEILDEMGLPVPEDMQQGDDFAAFMSRDVPEHLRRQALRTLWRSNPVLACVDGLNEYDDDYRAAMLLSEPIKTAYQVGQGMKSHIDEMARQAEAAEADETEEQIAQSDETLEAPDVEIDAAAPLTEEMPAAEAAGNEGTALIDEETPMPRRMRFRFEEAVA